MPDDRFIHPRLRMSQKVSALTDLEYRVWTDFILIADNFGVLPDLTALFKSNLALADRKDDDIRQAINNIVQTGLVLTFEHQGQRYLFDPLWQDFQKVRYPRTTFYPAPIPEIFPKLSAETQTLFHAYHPEFCEKKFVEGRADHRLTAKANGKRQTANGNGKTRTRERKPKEPKEPKPHPIRELLAAYEIAFRGRYHRKPLITGRDAKVAEEVLDGIDADRTKALPDAVALVHAFLASNDPFVVEKGHGLSLLPSQANRLLVGAKKPSAQDRANLSDKWAGVAPGRVKL